ncbi:AbiJ-NTD4 domain-containing protein [Stenotrophomonas rhizophila]|uniref:AbiJ-NTD4 domain-containing protein n=1 Tax=Stenotrophomonas rhizophila TaxID=216778 RepID=UPI003393E081
MLSDVFFNRYEGTPLWSKWSLLEQRLLVQCSQILEGDLFPIVTNADRKDSNSLFWDRSTSQLCRELGRTNLSATHYKSGGSWFPYNVRSQALNFLRAVPANVPDIDAFVKERLSLVELLFREAHERNGKMEATAHKSPGFFSAVHSRNVTALEAATEEINVRFARAGAPLNYHNGFIQISRDALSAQRIERPFWVLVDDPKWLNVDLEMKDAIDRRDSGASDSAFYASKALESAVKVIGHERRWSTGKERGAADHIDNLTNKTGDRMLQSWQVDSLKTIFSKVRNPLGHGAGPMNAVQLTSEEIDWAISTCMTWISYLVRNHMRRQAA